MYLINKPIDDIQEADIQNLRFNKVAEHKLIDYKEKLPGNSDGDKKEFLFDVSSFANASGGDLVFGIKEVDSVPTEICGLQIGIDAEIRRLESMIQTGIAPRIPGIALKGVQLQAGGAVLVVRIPKSWAGPHMVTFGGSSKFYSRNTKGKYPLDVGELRAAFVFSETVTEHIKNFRMERLGKIVAGETPVKLDEPPICVLHIIPIRAFDPTFKLDINPIANLDLTLDDRLRPLSSGGWNAPRHNFDGILVSSSRLATVEAYAQLFRNGIIESTTTAFANHRRERQLPSTYIEQQLIKILPFYFRALDLIGVELPVFIMLSFLGVEGYTLAVSGDFWQHEAHPIDRDSLLLPEILIETKEQKPEQLLKPAFDVLWNSVGWVGSMNYDKDGNWSQRR